ncbi:hypothetical protein AVEN_229180-1 [Araneus ventricosus]|uniref:Uncharacterized protein n=1 Tax=Araneus ventricosus TaxID=182803 RepID=A0A4Y2HLT4_ARAVE|nr:hypothetical protein AVEN_229180-1 [Araneus ventricosus]
MGHQRNSEITTLQEAKEWYSEPGDPEVMEKMPKLIFKIIPNLDLPVAGIDAGNQNDDHRNTVEEFLHSGNIINGRPLYGSDLRFPVAGINVGNQNHDHRTTVEQFLRSG